MSMFYVYQRIWTLTKQSIYIMNIYKLHYAMVLHLRIVYKHVFS